MASTATGLVVPAATDDFVPQVDLVALAQSMRSRIIVPVPNASGRDTLVTAISWTPSTLEPLRVWREDLGIEEYTTNGSTWRPRGAFAEDSGVASFTSVVTTPHSRAVTFATGRFTLPPLVQVSVVQDTSGSASGLVAVAHSVTTAGCTVTMVNTSGTSFGPADRRVHWFARQATLASAAG